MSRPSLHTQAMKKKSTSILPSIVASQAINLSDKRFLRLFPYTFCFLGRIKQKNLNSKSLFIDNHKQKIYEKADSLNARNIFFLKFQNWSIFSNGNNTTESSIFLYCWRCIFVTLPTITIALGIRRVLEFF